MRAALPFLIAALAVSPCLGRTLRVFHPDAIHQAARDANPGDVIELDAGEWSDAKLRVLAHGTKEAPITIRAQQPGKVILTGTSTVRIGGEHVVISGLTLRDIHDQSDWLELRVDSKNLAHHCRLTNCQFIESAGFDSGTKECRWVNLHGTDNVFDHCAMSGKKTKGTTVVVWLQEGVEVRHHLHHNHFGPRQRLGSNGGEALRVGDSKTSLTTASCLIEENLFEECNGEIECISNKSCGNTYRKNVFLKTQGTLTLRHGHRCLVNENVFIGEGVKFTGGIRIIGEDHTIRSNYLSGLQGEDARGAIVLQNGISDTPLNGYSPVLRATIENNTVLNCRQSLVIGYQDKDAKDATIAPADCSITGNRFIAGEKETVVHLQHGPVNFTWNDNLASGGELGISEIGGIQFSKEAPELPEVPATVHEVLEGAGR